MKIWLDDLRPAPDDGGWIQVFRAQDAIALLKKGDVEEISLDHDLGLGEVGTGYDVAVAIEQGAESGEIQPLDWHIHSSNPVGRKKMEAALRKADSFWFGGE